MNSEINSLNLYKMSNPGTISGLDTVSVHNALQDAKLELLSQPNARPKGGDGGN